MEARVNGHVPGTDLGPYQIVNFGTYRPQFYAYPEQDVIVFRYNIIRITIGDKKAKYNFYDKNGDIIKQNYKIDLFNIAIVLASGLGGLRRGEVCG